MPYSDKLIDHFNNPRNVGSMDKNAKDVGTGIVGAPECGDVMKLQIQVDSEGRIVDAKFKTFGCGSAIASSSLATEWLKGRKVEEATDLRNTDIVEALSSIAVGHPGKQARDLSTQLLGGLFLCRAFFVVIGADKIQKLPTLLSEQKP